MPEFGLYGLSRDFPDDKGGTSFAKFIKKVGKLKTACQLTRMADRNKKDVYAWSYMSKLAKTYIAALETTPNISLN